MQDVIQLRRRIPYTYADDKVMQAPAPTHRRASLNDAQPLKQTRYQNQATQSAPNTADDRQIISSIPQQYLSYQPHQPRRQGKPWFYVVVGMFGALVIWSLLLHIEAWYMNTLHDPSTYTQTAHLDIVSVTDTQGHQSQARAFVDSQDHIDLLVIPRGDTSKARIIVGPVLSSNIDDPQHRAMIEATAHGMIVTITVQGPLVARWIDFTPYRQSVQWTADTSQPSQPSSKGGK